MNYEIRNYSGKKILGNLEASCARCIGDCSSESQIITCTAYSQKRRQGIKRNDSGSVYICSPEIELINSSRIFKEKLKIRFETLELLINSSVELEERNQKQIKRLIHNLTTLNAHCILDLYSLVSQEELSEVRQEKRINLIEDSIKSDPRLAADTFSKILKNNILMKVEFSVFNKLYETNPRLDKRPHQIRKVVLNVLHVFFPDFTDKEVQVVVDQFEEKVNIDYESITVVLMHLIENASKYIQPRSNLNIKFKIENEQIKIYLEMSSFKIFEDESELIFEEGYSGKASKALGYSGKGIGLYLVRRLLDINSGTIIINKNFDSSKATKMNGFEFEQNQFIICLPTK